MNKLRYFRRKVGMTQYELASLAGFTAGAISHYERGRRGLDLTGCRLLVNILNSKGANAGIDDVFPPDAA
ncbi:putative transcriptional regulator [Izhakiella capsodis]|uniref:Putative transcriptional regulator n=1 Tax=Izhakiella capsodis TaxID=1367852 RepID=A0A1I5BR24_9GAMM|nr:helix-turn-helix transcriptional regulator [Izhakiella capsodis]SFN77107.1 putative transcriptional regulator [Izhakiella capsodis]